MSSNRNRRFDDDEILEKIMSATNGELKGRNIDYELNLVLIDNLLSFPETYFVVSGLLNHLEV